MWQEVSAMQRPSFALLMLCGALALGLTAADRTNRPKAQGKVRTRAAARNLEPTRSKPQPASTLATSFVVAFPTVESRAVELPAVESPAVVTLETEVPQSETEAAKSPASAETSVAIDTQATAETPTAVETPTVAVAETGEATNVPVEQVDSATAAARLPETPTESLIPHWLTTGEEDPVDTRIDTLGDAAEESSAEESSAEESPAEASVEVPVGAASSPSTSWEPVGVAAQRVAMRAATSLDRVATMFQRLAESLRRAANEAVSEEAKAEANPSALPSSPPQAGG